MNQRTLLITIVAVAAIIILIALWLSGAGQTEPLSGRMGGTILTATLDRSTCHNVWQDNREGTLKGKLTSDTGLPLGNKTIVIYSQTQYPGWSIDPPTVTTQADGSFSRAIGWLNNYGWDFKARFPGDAENLPAESAVIADIYC